MKNNGILSTIKTTIVGGIFFLLPIVLIAFGIGKALVIIHKIVAVILDLIPGENILRPPLPGMLAILILLLFCFFAGLLAKKKSFGRFGEWVEQNILTILPGYDFLKSMGENIAGLETDKTKMPVLVELDETWQIGFLMDKVNEEISTVFLPGSPSPTSGDVVFVKNSRLKPLDINPKDAMKIMSHMGIGSAKQLEGVFKKNG